MNIINQAMMYLLDVLHHVVGNYGLAIVALTVLIRAVLWPMNTAQTRNMKKMQELQPKLKALQDKHKDNPQKMQEALLKFYAENRFNPLAGCLPMLIQIPIFIGLYGAISNPAFLAQVGHEHFLFIDNLSHTLYTYAGESLDGTFNVVGNDRFSTAKTVKVTYDNGEKVEMPVHDVHKAVPVVGQSNWLAGEPLTFTLDFSKLGVDKPNRVTEIQTVLVNEKSRELETIDLKRAPNGDFLAQIPTVKAEEGIHWKYFNTDVLILILIYGAFTLLYSKVMGAKPPVADKEDAAAAAQANMMRYMPLLFVVMMFFIPLPAGVLIYLVVTTALMFIQTWWVHWREDQLKAANAPKPSSQVIDVKPD